MSSLVTTIVAAVAVVSGFFWLAIQHGQERQEDFKAICRISGGVEVHNGQHWVCLYPQGQPIAPTGSHV